MKRETWSGRVNGHVERTHDADFQVALESVNGAWPAHFNHDADGLLTRAGALAITRRASDGLISGTSVGVVTSAHSYDSHGELWRLRYEVSGGLLFQQELTRDSLGRIVQVVLPGADTVRYVHDGLGRRVERRQAGTATRRWLYGDAVPPVAELDEADAVVARYVYGTWGHSPDMMLTPSAGYRVVTDHLGSVRMLVDTLTGEVKRHVQRTAWGVTTLDTGSVATSLGYAGGLTDPATGLVRFGARDYDPETGRWTAKDPIGLAGGTNVYAYAANRPERLVDPEGAAAEDPNAFDLAEFVVGFGDSYLISELVRDLQGLDNVDKCSPSYRVGRDVGFLWGLVPIGLRASAALGGTRAFGFLNKGKFIGIGPGRFGRTMVPRISIYPRGAGAPHVDLRTRLPVLPPIRGNVGRIDAAEGDCECP